MRADAEYVGGHSILAVERFRDDTRHMIIFDVLTSASALGSPGDCLRRFLSDGDYAAALVDERNGNIKIIKHAAIIEGHILDDRKKKRRH